MNFSLHKAVCKKRLSTFIFFLFLFVGFFRCVAIEDLLPPSIGDFTLQEQYDVTETIFLDVLLTDNFALNEVIVKIQKINGDTSSTLNRTDTIRTNVRARLLTLERYPLVVIPADAALGQYELTLTVVDGNAKTDATSNVERKAPNRFSVTKTFTVVNSRPEPLTDIILDLTLTVDLSITVVDVEAKEYKACRSSIIPISGEASDNVALDKISAQFEGYPNSIINRDLSGVPSVNLREVFGSSIVVPNTIPNGQTIKLIFTVTDTDDNVGSDTLFFLIDCDDQNPVIESIITNLNDQIDEEGQIEVIEGQELFIERGEIRDRLGILKDVSIYFDGSTVPLRTWDINQESINLSNLDGFPFRIPIPSTASVGTLYNIEIRATDVAGNIPDIYTLIIEIKDNDNPSIGVLGTLVDGNPTSFSTNRNSSVAVSAGLTIRFIGRIFEDVALENYRITWGVEGNEQVVIEEDNLISNVPIDREFEIDENARAGTYYVLTIYARDTFDQESQVKYYFIVR